MIFSRDYLRVFIPLAIAFAIYHVTFVPWIGSTNHRANKRWDAPVLVDVEEWWDVHFVEGAWQRESPQILRTKIGTLLYQTKEELSDTRWKIKPLTILIPQGRSGTNQRAIIIANPEGAEIQFPTAPNFSSDPPPIESGKLLGKIRIYSPPDENTTDNGLVIDTSEVRIEKRQIWTDKSIKMQMGNSLIEGHFLTINLEQRILSPESGVSPGRKSPFDGLESLELTYVDRVRVGLKNGGLWPSKKIENAHLLNAYAVLKCGGRFTFNFPQSEATLRGGVDMEHHVEGLPVDTFACEELTLQVGFHNEQLQVDEQGARKRSPWKLEKLTAIGAMGKSPTDRSRWMKLLAPGMQVEAMGQRLFIDFLNGEINLSNTLPLAAAQDSTPVYLRRESMQVWSPEILYGNPSLFARQGSTDGGADGQSAPFDRLGTVIAAGPGVAQMEDETESWNLSWGQKLLVRPVEQLDVVSIVGRANIKHSSEGSYRADKLDLWLRPTDPARHALLRGYYPDQEVPRWLPEAMKAEGGVRVDSERLIAGVDSMNLLFAYPTHEAPASAGASQSPPQAPQGIPPDPTLANASTSATVRQPSSPAPTSLQPPPHPPETSERGVPFAVAAKSLQATVRTEGKKSSIEALALDGNFQMRREFLSESSPWPFAAHGTQLRLRETGSNQVNLHLVGEPAKVQLGTGEVVAPELHLSQSDNLFHIDHPGVMVVPPEAIPLDRETNPNITFASTSAQGMPMTLADPRAGRDGGKPMMQWVDPPRLQWGERMTFDGRTARFGGGVDFTCRIQNGLDTISHVVVQSKSLAIDLVAPVPLHSIAPDQKTQAKVELIRFEENVDIKVAQTGLDNQRHSTEHMKLPRLDISMGSQTFLGYGPGELWSRRFAAKGQLPGLGNIGAPSQESPANPPMSLQCLHLSFMGRLEGDLKTRKASFYERIEALMGPIVSWEDQVNVHHAEHLGPNQTSLISDQLDIFDGSLLSYNQISPTNRPASQPTAWEIEALSRVRIETLSDKGRISLEGHSAKYGARDDHVQIFGSPRQTAVVTLHPLNGSSGQEVRLSNISMHLKTGNIKGNIDRIEGTLPNEYQRAGVPVSQPPATTPANQGPPLPDPRLRGRN